MMTHRSLGENKLSRPGLGESRILKSLVVAMGPVLARLVSCAQVLETGAQQASLKRINPKIATNLGMVVPLFGAVDAQDASFGRKSLVVSGHKTGIAVASEVLGWKKGEGPKAGLGL